MGRGRASVHYWRFPVHVISMTPARWQLFTFQIVSVLGVLLLGAFAASAGSVAEHWHPRELMRALSISCALGLLGLFASALLLRRHPELRNSQSVMVFVCGVALTAVQIVAIWTVVLPPWGTSRGSARRASVWNSARRLRRSEA